MEVGELGKNIKKHKKEKVGSRGKQEKHVGDEREKMGENSKKENIGEDRAA